VGGKVGHSMNTSCQENPGDFKTQVSSFLQLEVRPLEQHHCCKRLFQFSLGGERTTDSSHWQHNLMFPDRLFSMYSDTLDLT